MNANIRANIRNVVQRLAPAALLRSYQYRALEKDFRVTRCQSGRFEPELGLLPLLLANSAPGSVIDVGANVGHYTFFLQKCFDAFQIYAVEPQAAMHRRLERLFPNVHLFRIALSDCPGDLALKIPIVQGAPLRSRATLEQFSEIGETGATFETVPVETLDRLCDRAGIRNIRFIKIDVEGHEHRVIAGARRVLAQWRPILQVEIEQRHHRSPIGDIVASIQQHGYAGFYFQPREQRLLPVSGFSVAEHQNVSALGGLDYINNFLFVSDSSASQCIETVHGRLKVLSR